MEIKLGRGPKNISSISGDSIGLRTVDVKIDAAVAEQIKQYTLSDTSRELGGILLGTCTEKPDCYHIQIKAAIEARYTEADQSSLTFTHESWDYMNKERERCYPQFKIMGWFHSHPDFGIFLSSHDIFIQQNFFDLPWLVAYVVDPLGDKAGLFGWHNTKLVPLPFAIDDMIYPVSASENRTISRSAFNNSRDATRTGKSLLLVSFIAALGYTYWFFNNKRPLHGMPLPPGSEYYYDGSIIDTLYRLFWQSIEELRDLLNSLINYLG